MFGIEKDFQNLMEQVYGPLNKDKMTEIEELKGQIKVLEKKLALLEQIEEHKSPVEKAYRDAYGNYPITDDMSGSDIDYVSWDAFQKGYNAAYAEKVSEEQLTTQKGNIKTLVEESVKWCEEHPDKDPLDCLKPQTPDQVDAGLKEAFREAIKGGIIPEVNKPTDELIEKLVKNPPEFLKFELGQCLTDLIYDWWEDIFTVQSNDDMETSIDDLVSRIEKWLPKPQSAAGSQSLGVEDMVEGFNDCLNKIKRKLR